MKQFKLLTFFIAVIACMQPIFGKEPSTNKTQQSITAYIYSNILQQSTMLPAAQDASKKIIIFDLDGVLCTTNQLRACQEIGIETIRQYFFEHFKFPSSQLLFETLEQAPAVTTYDAYNEKGLRMPQIMIDWQVGAQDLRDIQDTMITHISSLDRTITEKNLHIQTILMMTTPTKFITTRQVIPDGIQLARALKKLNYKLYILSNWDPTSFPLFVEKFPDFFTFEGKNLFDGIMISGQERVPKPNKEIFTACLHKFNIQKSQAIFIDDTIENIVEAEKMGIESIHCKNRNIADVKKQLIQILNS
ncbi:MAG: HAD-IA family hydrolase [Candidatus Dependentiae bacterium]|nr:HAD-IA family hydrolase [Candidatus Dependentiae bacterium]